MVRPTGWGLCIPPELPLASGAWIIDQELDLFRPDCWMNWGQQPLASDDRRFIPMLWSPRSYTPDALPGILGQHPGRTWLLWNEPDHPGQANISPQKAFEETLRFLCVQWDLGHEFQWAAAGTMLRNLDWLTEYVRLLRRHGISRPSYWHVHSYESNTLENFRTRWREWERWYTQWGVETPVVLSEVCAEARLIDQQKFVMDECRMLLDRERVAGVLWFASHETPAIGWTDYPLCKVSEDRLTLTNLGKHWVSLK